MMTSSCESIDVEYLDEEFEPDSDDAEVTIVIDDVEQDKDKLFQSCMDQDAKINADNNNQTEKGKSLKNNPASKPATYILHHNLVQKDSSSLDIPPADDGNNATENKATAKLQDAAPKNKKGETVQDDDVGRKDSKEFKISLSFLPQYDDDEYDSQFEGKSSREIMYDIAMGKWSRKNLVLDKERRGTRKLGCRPCSNANCVREAEKQERKKRLFRFNMSEESITEEQGTLFEDGSLPSYHSLLNVWKDKKCSWNKTIFERGHPLNENEFLDLWRECRKFPEAYGIKISPPEELPELSSQKLKHRLKKLEPRTRNESKLKNWSPNPVNNPMPMERKSIVDLRRRFDELKRLYPHLQPLSAADYKTREKLNLRLRQAEDWHRLVNYEPKEVVKMNTDPPTPYSDENLTEEKLEVYRKAIDRINKNIPRYATSTKSFSRKIRPPQAHPLSKWRSSIG